MKKLLAIILGTILCVSAQAREKESYYQEGVCKKYEAKMEVINYDKTRVDCLTPYRGTNLSIEVDFPEKWYECLTQALYYSAVRDNSAVCVLVVTDTQEYKYVERARDLVKMKNLPVQVHVYQGGIDK